MEDNNYQIMAMLHDAIPQTDEKQKIIELLEKRLDFGYKKYGHGVRIYSNINEYNTNWNNSVTDMNWSNMMIEEALDGLIYIMAEVIRNPHKKHSIIYDALQHQVSALKCMLQYQEIQ